MSPTIGISKIVYDRQTAGPKTYTIILITLRLQKTTSTPLSGAGKTHKFNVICIFIGEQSF